MKVTTTAVAVTPGAAGTPAPTNTCPTEPTRTFAKTRFVVNAGLATGAFKRYVYTPYRSGSFKSDAPGRKKALVKAAAAGVFTLDQLRRARNNVHADPGLCRTLSAPIDRLSAAIAALAAKFKKGEVDPASIDGVSSGIAGFRKASGDAGARFKDHNPPADLGG